MARKAKAVNDVKSSLTKQQRYRTRQRAALAQMEKDLGACNKLFLWLATEGASEHLINEARMMGTTEQIAEYLLEHFQEQLILWKHESAEMASSLRQLNELLQAEGVQVA